MLSSTSAFSFQCVLISFVKRIYVQQLFAVVCGRSHILRSDSFAFERVHIIHYLWTLVQLPRIFIFESYLFRLYPCMVNYIEH